MFRIVMLTLALAASAVQAAEQGPGPGAPEGTAGEDSAQPPGPTLTVMPAGTHRLDEFLWVARPLVIFADTPADPRFIDQIEELATDPAELIAREVVVLVDTDPAARSPIREALRPHGFNLVLIGKDGLIYMRRPTPQTLREIVRSIDKMPLRREEIKERKLITRIPPG